MFYDIEIGGCYPDNDNRYRVERIWAISDIQLKTKIKSTMSKMPEDAYCYQICKPVWGCSLWQPIDDYFNGSRIYARYMTTKAKIYSYLWLFGCGFIYKTYLHLKFKYRR
jgi:hypothetical protein